MYVRLGDYLIDPLKVQAIDTMDDSLEDDSDSEPYARFLIGDSLQVATWLHVNYYTAKNHPIFKYFFQPNNYMIGLSRVNEEDFGLEAVQVDLEPVAAMTRAKAVHGKLIRKG